MCWLCPRSKVIFSLYSLTVHSFTVNQATINQDYLALRETFTFAPSHLDEIKCVNFTTLNDTIYEGTESRPIVLTSDSNITLMPKSTLVSILDSDSKFVIYLTHNRLILHSTNIMSSSAASWCGIHTYTLSESDTRDKSQWCLQKDYNSCSYVGNNVASCLFVILPQSFHLHGFTSATS